MFNLIAVLLLIALLLWGVAGIVTNQVTGGTSWGHMPPQTKAERRAIVERWADRQIAKRTPPATLPADEQYGEAS